MFTTIFSQRVKIGNYIVLYISILILNLQMATPNYIEAQIPKKFTLGLEISDNAALWEIFEMIGETSNPIFPQENDGLKRIRNSLRILKRSSKQHPFPYDDLSLSLGMDFFYGPYVRLFFTFCLILAFPKNIKNLAKKWRVESCSILALHTFFD